MKIPRIALIFLLVFTLLTAVTALDDDGESSDSSNTTTVPPPGNSTTDSATQPDQNATDSTSALQTMFINTRKPALSSPITTEVFSNGRLSSAFINCTLETTPNSTDCFMDDAYNDRLSFQLTVFDITAHVNASIEARRPEVSTTLDSQNKAGPSVITAPPTEDVVMNLQDPNSLIVTVVYNCKSNADGIVPIRLVLHLGDDETSDVIIHWQKECTNGVNDKMSFGYLTGIEEMGTAEPHSFGTDTAALVTVGASDESTEFFLKLGQPGALQAFQPPYVTSTFSDIVSIHVRGNHPQGGIIEGLKITKFQVGYECHRKGEATIEANIGIPPFQNVSAVWKKDCGGNAATNLQVGTQEDGFDIVDNGEPTPRYMVGIESIGQEHSSEHLHLPGNQSDWGFYIKNGDDTSNADESDAAMLIGRITATIEKPAVLYPMTPAVMTRSAMSWSRTASSSISLGAGDSLKVSLPLVCRNLGESRVLITVPILGYKELEFGIAKVCTHVGTAHRSSEFFLTVQNIFWFAVMTIVIGGCALLYLRRKRAKQGVTFTPLPTSEQV